MLSLSVESIFEDETLVCCVLHPIRLNERKPSKKGNIDLFIKNAGREN